MAGTAESITRHPLLDSYAERSPTDSRLRDGPHPADSYAQTALPPAHLQDGRQGRSNSRSAAAWSILQRFTPGRDGLATAPSPATAEGDSRRPEERRGGKAGVSTCRFRRAPLN